jgi:hypothetical protein
MTAEQLDRVTVAYSRGTVTIPRASCDALLEEIRPLDSLIRARRAFEAVGAAAPVRLERKEVASIVQIIDIWMSNVRGPNRLPEGIFELRNALVDDLHDTTV